MLQFSKYIPLSLYIHIPWCIRKCPYCDFNSHTTNGEIPEKVYIKRLVHDLEQDLALINERPITSIFIGGGTPSLMSPEAYQVLFAELKKRLDITTQAEITLEANPGTVEQSYFKGYFELGINRISLGIQSLQDDKLKALGRIHTAEQANLAMEAARSAGFQNVNIDLMYALPGQKVDEALSDLNNALKLKPEHISWYHLTLEPNTLFYKHPPSLPEEDLVWEMQEQGHTLLTQAGYQQYETSAYAQPKHSCAHNLNYWLFGDYLGIGAGAHGKVTDFEKAHILRSLKLKNPRDYLTESKNCRSSLKAVDSKELALEFMMNALRLYMPIPLSLFTERTGLGVEQLKKSLNKATQAGFLYVENEHLHLNQQGHLFLNELLELFMQK